MCGLQVEHPGLRPARHPYPLPAAVRRAVRRRPGQRGVGRLPVRPAPAPPAARGQDRAQNPRAQPQSRGPDGPAAGVWSTAGHSRRL